MTERLQKASFGKRIIAAIFDGITITILAVGLAVGLSSALKYDSYMDTVNSAYEKYETQYGVEFQITQEEYLNLDEKAKEKYDTAYKALTEDKDVTYAYNMLINLTLIILTFSVLFGVIIVEFIVPLLFGNGQTLGKKIFGIALMHVDSVKISGIQLFARAVLGKFTFEIMIPLTVIIMIFFNLIGLVGTIILLAIVIAEIICLVYNKKNMLLHDVIAATVCVDFLSQKIFDSQKEKEDFIKKKAADEAEKAAY